MPPTPVDRNAALEYAKQHPNVSVLIVGGGINGAGLFRELALQGVDALLVDKSDFCAGASAASSRMIHGGLRYLEFGEFRLVRESLAERNRLLQNAPHYVRPLPTVIPVLFWFSGIGAGASGGLCDAQPGICTAFLRFARATPRPSRCANGQTWIAIL